MSDSLIAFDRNNQPVEAPLSAFTTRVSIYGLLIVDGKILLQRSPFNNMLNLPGGAIEIGESPQQALSREFLEETGYNIESEQILDAASRLFTYDNQFFHAVLIFARVKQLSSDVKPIIDVEDSLEAGFYDLKTLDFSLVNPIYHNIIKQYCHES